MGAGESKAAASAAAPASASAGDDPPAPAPKQGTWEAVRASAPGTSSSSSWSRMKRAMGDVVFRANAKAKSDDDATAAASERDDDAWDGKLEGDYARAPPRGSHETYLSSPTFLHERILAFQYEGDRREDEDADATDDDDPEDAASRERAEVDALDVSRTLFLDDDDDGYVNALEDAADVIAELRGGDDDDDGNLNANDADANDADDARVMLVNVSDRKLLHPELYHMFDAHGAVREHECDWEWPRRAEVLPMATLLEICAETHAWLSESKSNLVCLHARGGVGCGAARMLRFVAASYLCYAGVHDDVVDAFDALASPPPSRAWAWSSLGGGGGAGGVPRSSPREADGGSAPGTPTGGGGDRTGGGRELFFSAEDRAMAAAATNAPPSHGGYGLTRGGGGGGGGAASSASAANIRNNGRASSVTHAAYQPPPSGSATSTCAQRRYAHWLLMTSRGAFGPAARAGRGKAMTLRAVVASAAPPLDGRGGCRLYALVHARGELIGVGGVGVGGVAPRRRAAGGGAIELTLRDVSGGGGGDSEGVDAGVAVRGDVAVSLCHWTGVRAKDAREPVAVFAFHTGFVEPGEHRATLRQLDVSDAHRRKIPENFYVDVRLELDADAPLELGDQPGDGDGVGGIGIDDAFGCESSLAFGREPSSSPPGLRGVCWDVTPPERARRGTWWTDVDGAFGAGGVSLPPHQEDALREAFAASPKRLVSRPLLRLAKTTTRRATEAAAAPRPPPASPPPRPSFVSLARETIVVAVTRKLRVDVAAAATAVAIGDPERSLSLDELRALLRAAPTEDESAAVAAAEFVNDAAFFHAMTPAERALQTLAAVPRLKPKLRTLCFARYYFERAVEDVELALRDVAAACECVRRSAAAKNGALRVVLATALACGNALNEGNARGGATGFSLDSLHKLADVKAKTPRAGGGRSETLLDFVVAAADERVVGEGEADVEAVAALAPSLTRDLAACERGGACPTFDDIADALGRIEGGIAMATREADAAAAAAAAAGGGGNGGGGGELAYAGALRAFVARASPRVAALRDDAVRADAAYRALCLYVGEGDGESGVAAPPAPARPPSDIFGSVWAFARAVDASRARRVALEKRRALEASVAANARDDSEDELESPAARRSNTLAADDELAAYSW